MLPQELQVRAAHKEEAEFVARQTEERQSEVPYLGRCAGPNRSTNLNRKIVDVGAIR